MAFRHPQTQHERLFADRGDGVAVQHDRTLGQRNGQHAPGDRGQHLALLQVLQCHRTFGGSGAYHRCCHLRRGTRLVHRGSRSYALAEQGLRASQIGLRLGKLRLQTGDLCVERVDLQGKLVVADHRDHLPRRHDVTVMDRQAGHGAADPGARRHDIGALDSGEYRLLVGQLTEVDGECRLRARRRGEADGDCHSNHSQVARDRQGQRQTSRHQATSQRARSSARGRPPACTSLPSMTTPGVDIAP